MHTTQTPARQLRSPDGARAGAASRAGRALAHGWRAVADAGAPTHAAIGYTLLHAAWVFFGFTGPNHRELIGNAFFLPVGAAMALMAWANARDPRLPDAGRTGWRWLAAAYLVLGISTDFWAVNDVLLGRSTVLHAIVDSTTALYLVLLTRGILAFNPVRETKASDTKIALDFATIFIAAAALIWYFMLRPRYAAASQLTWTVASSLLSPVGDLLGVLAIALILMRGSNRVSMHALWIMGAGHLSMVAADLLYTPLSLAGTYRGGDPVDILWMVGDALVVIGAAYQHRVARVARVGTAVPTRAQQHFSRLPYLFIVVGFLPIVVAAERWTRNDRLVLYATVVLTVLVLARQFAAMRDNEELARGRELQEARFRSLVQRASDMIAVVDADGIIRYLSGSAERLSGYPAEMLIGESMTERLHPQDVAAALALLEQARGGATPAPAMRLRVRHRDGTWIPIETVATNMLADPAVQGIVLNSRDVSERVALEAQLLHAQKMDAVGRLAGGIAHDFNNLLTAIRMTATLVVDELPNGSPLAEELHEIERSVDRGSSLTRQLLAFSKRELLQPTLVDPAEVIAGLEPMLRRLIATDVVVEIDAPLQQWRVFADPGQLEQVVLNLSLNARDAMPESGRLFIGVGATTIDVATARGNPGLLPGDYVTITVRDSGIGMSPEVQAHLFEPFFTTKEIGKGTGLGLSTVYAIVQRCGGTIPVHSAPGEGSTFTVFLPRAVTDTATAPAGVLAPTMDVGREMILVVDDEETVRMAVRRILQKSGYRVVVAANGVEALELLESDGLQVAMILTDMMMPEMGGRELVERVSISHPGIRILCMSGYTEDPTLRLGQLAGEHGFIAKPFTVAELTAAIRQVLDGSSAAGSEASRLSGASSARG